MEDVLDVYKRIKDTSHPLVCMDECPKQLIGETRPPIAGEPGRAERFDTEFESAAKLFYGGKAKFLGHQFS